MLLNTILWIIRSQSKCLAVNALEIFFCRLVSDYLADRLSEGVRSKKTVDKSCKYNKMRRV